MPKFSSSDDLYRVLVQDADVHWLGGLVAFATMEEQRIEWSRHMLDTTGKLPTSAEIQAYYEQLAPGRILTAKGAAESALQRYTQEVLEEVDETYRSEVREGELMKEMQKSKEFWPQFHKNLFSNLLSSLIFAFMLFGLAFIIFHDESPVDMADRLHNPEGAKNGK